MSSSGCAPPMFAGEEGGDARSPVSFTSPVPGWTRMFWGLRSLCTTPRRWTSASASGDSDGELEKAPDLHGRAEELS